MRVGHSKAEGPVREGRHDQARAQRDDCYRAVIDGATAIEVAFPPVFIDGEMYGDGGVRQHVFLVSPKNALPPDTDMSNVTLRMITCLACSQMPSRARTGSKIVPPLFPRS
jgi:hypothetical protein